MASSISAGFMMRKTTLASKNVRHLAYMPPKVRNDMPKRAPIMPTPSRFMSPNYVDPPTNHEADESMRPQSWIADGQTSLPNRDHVAASVSQELQDTPPV
ncbi:hypothetical protein ACFE04_016058 [Oxalis oulophora]